MKIYKQIILSFFLLVICDTLFAQSLTVTATSSPDGNTITIVSKTSSCGSSTDYSVQISSSFGNYSYIGSDVSAFSSPGIKYTINVTATCRDNNGHIVYTVLGGTTLTTKNPTPPIPPNNNPCILRLLNGLTFDDSYPDGTPLGEGEILVSWTPLLKVGAPPAALYQFRYRIEGTSTWTYCSSQPSVLGFLYNGHTYGFFPITGLQPNGVEYEIQVAYVCALPGNFSDYSSSYYAFTLVD